MPANAGAIHPAKSESRCWRPLFASPVPAGFPSPADDYIERSLDLNEHLIKHPAATFFVRASGDSMLGNIHSGDLLVVDRAKEAGDGSIVIAVIDGELTVKRLRKRGNGVSLESDNPAYAPLSINEEADVVVWGVVTNVIHPV
jgi:DNA polymerase V